MPSREQVDRAVATVADLRVRHHGRIVIDAVVPDYYARYPKRRSGRPRVPRPAHDRDVYQRVGLRHQMDVLDGDDALNTPRRS
jgi:hypothetical protein